MLNTRNKRRLQYNNVTSIDELNGLRLNYNHRSHLTIKNKANTGDDEHSNQPYKVDVQFSNDSNQYVLSVQFFVVFFVFLFFFVFLKNTHKKTKKKLIFSPFFFSE